MIYDSLFYIPSLFLSVLIYWNLQSVKWRHAFLALASIAIITYSLGFYQNLTQSMVVPILLSGMVFLMGQWVRAHPKLLYLFLTITVPLTFLCFYKYFTPLIEKFFHVPYLAFPLGISYYSFKHFHYLIECSRGRFEGRSLSEYFSYIFFFPMFIAGPIERFDRYTEQAEKAAFSWDNVSLGLERILMGMMKKFILADLIIYSLIPSTPFMKDFGLSLEWYQLWVVFFLRFLLTYFDFSGYTDMIIGTGKFFGFDLMENFNFPVLRASIADFWRAWHISLSSWARDYVYFPLLIQLRNTTIPLMATMLTIGLWHSAHPLWIIWGLHHGSGLVIHSYFQRTASKVWWLQNMRQTKLWNLFGVLAVWWWVSLGYCLTFPMIGRYAPALYVKLITFGWVDLS